MVDEIKVPTNIENISQLYDNDPTTQNVEETFVEIDSPLTVEEEVNVFFTFFNRFFSFFHSFSRDALSSLLKYACFAA